MSSAMGSLKKKALPPNRLDLIGKPENFLKRLKVARRLFFLKRPFEPAGAGLHRVTAFCARPSGENFIFHRRGNHTPCQTLTFCTITHYVVLCQHKKYNLRQSRYFPDRHNIGIYLFTVYKIGPILHQSCPFFE